MLPQILKVSSQVTGKSGAQSAFHPILLFSVLTLLIGAYLALNGPMLVQIAGVILMLPGPGLFVFAYGYCLLKKPDMLRSEQHDLRRMALGMIEQKGGELPISSTSVEAIANLAYEGTKAPGEDE